MSTLQIRREVTVDDAQRALSNELGSHYRVSVDSRFHDQDRTKWRHPGKADD